MVKYDKILIMIMACTILILGMVLSSYERKIDVLYVTIDAHKAMEERLVGYNEQLTIDKQKLIEETEKLEAYRDESTSDIEDMIIKYANKYGVDWKIAIAISRLETGNYTSNAYTQYNNVGGMMYHNGSEYTLIKFDTRNEGVCRFIRNLKRLYFDEGLDTLQKIQPIYCPNSNGWLTSTTSIYNEL